ncbi:TraB/GumN family protein [Maribacter ulvicola]|uniref:TraB family protein n=1 Tax=Maribacter ulvicola TaxID=228959 RepID=A0A1N6NIC7_9FLAO|nr:TraB/GumN family protein [Maribacter ulvicola]SIP91777.1 hypothetical protein SAMN05421797_1015 [Maribacter ulvicola]
MIFLKLPSILLLCVLVCSIATAQEKINIENSVLWKVELQDLNTPSFIFGTLHIMCEDDFMIPEKIQNVLSNVNALVLEINLSDSNEIQQLQEATSNPKIWH